MPKVAGSISAGDIFETRCFALVFSVHDASTHICETIMHCPHAIRVVPVRKNSIDLSFAKVKASSRAHFSNHFNSVDITLPCVLDRHRGLRGAHAHTESAYLPEFCGANALWSQECASKHHVLSKTSTKQRV